MVGIGTTGGFSAVLASNPWLVARVLAYLRIATVAARVAAAVHACMVWLVCVVVTYGVESWINLGASRPAVNGSLPPVCMVLPNSSMAPGYGVPLGVGGTA